MLDSQVLYAADGTLQGMEVSTRCSGRFDGVEFYDSGVLAKVTRTTTATAGRLRETYRPEPAAASGGPKYAITSAAFDDEARGTPQRLFVYGTNGQIAR